MNAPARPLIAQAFETCVGIVRFRKGPEDVPASTALLVAAVAGGVLMRILLLSLPTPEPPTSPVALIALDIGISLLCLNFALRLASYPERFTQTATAIFGCQVVMAPALLASRWMLLTYFEQPGIGGLARLFYVIVAVWLLAVTARVLRSATGWPMFAAVLLALTIEVLTVLAALSLFPAAATAAADATAAA